MFLTLILTFNMTENSFLYALREEGGLAKPDLIHFYNYSTIAIGIFWTWLIFVYIAGSIGCYVYKGIHSGFEKIHRAKNQQKVAIKKGLTAK